MGVVLGLEGEESIAQNIRTILLTEKGSVPFRPRMGVGSFFLLDSNINRMEIKLEIIDQINTYEPRIKVKQVLFREGENATQINIAIKYQIIETGEDKAYIHSN